MQSLARIVSSIFYRIRYEGPGLPDSGPLLLVANHPNSLLDPILVLASSGRPVRFLAKAPLFSDPRTAWLVRLGGAIPVFRPQDSPGEQRSNDGMFRAVHAALTAGSAIGIFPEGLSHSEPELAPLRTGAARIALGTALALGREFPVIPVGLVFDAKSVFRSRALVLRGEPVGWTDLVERGAEDSAAVRELTARIEASLRRQTINFSSWQDEPAVQAAVQIWEAERGTFEGAAGHILGLGEATRILAEARLSEDPGVEELSSGLRTHSARLRRLGLRPADLVADPSQPPVRPTRLLWAVVRLPLELGIAVAGWVAFIIPYRLTGAAVGRLALAEDVLSTWKALLGGAIYALWVGGVLVATWWWAGWLTAFALLFGIPAVGLVGLVIRERWRSAWAEGRRFLRVRSLRTLVSMLAERQGELADLLEQMWHRYPPPKD